MNEILKELTELKQWVCYNKNKIPMNATTGKPAKTDEPETWSDYKTASNAVKNNKYYNGIGFVFNNKNYFGVDIDDCIENKKIKPYAQKIINYFDSYTEISPSGKGIHIICKGVIPGAIGATANKGFEMYGNGRYFTMTGNVYGTAKPINERSEKGTTTYNYYKNNYGKENTDKTQKEQTKGYTVNEGSRNSTLISFMGSLRAKSVPKEDIIKAVELFNELNINPPLTDQELQTNIFSNLDRPFKGDKQQQAKTNPLTNIESLEEYNGITALTELVTQINDTNIKYYSTGFNELDTILDGGLYPGLYVMGAISGLGKTTLALQIADNLAQSGNDVIIFALEMSKTELVGKTISRLSYIQNNELAKTYREIIKNDLTTQERENIKTSIATYKDFAKRVYIYENNGKMNIDFINERIKNHIALTGKYPIVFVDYLQIINGGNVYDNKIKNDENITQLKIVSRQYNIPIFVISSFNRDNYNQAVNMGAFKETGAIEYTCDVLIGLQPEGLQEVATKQNKENQKITKRCKENNERSLEAVILKNRNGKNGTCYFSYNAEFNFFEQQSKEKHLKESVKRIEEKITLK